MAEVGAPAARPQAGGCRAGPAAGGCRAGPAARQTAAVLATPCPAWEEKTEKTARAEAKWPQWAGMPQLCCSHGGRQALRAAGRCRCASRGNGVACCVWLATVAATAWLQPAGAVGSLVASEQETGQETGQEEQVVGALHVVLVADGSG